jgi:hypothetical protein
LPDIRYQPPLLATGFYLNEAANEQSGQNDRSMRHSRNSFAAYLQRRDERRITIAGQFAPEVALPVDGVSDCSALARTTVFG